MVILDYVPKLKKLYELANEGGTDPRFPRHSFRNMSNLSEMFPLIRVDLDDSMPYDVYKIKGCDAEIMVVGGDSHCHVGAELGKYKEGIVFLCEESEKQKVITALNKLT